ncbi:hypothetical protein TNCV_4697181 [Trichonephila clavipes]|nr:hypothetical protein TNCV_4697181 [Trichonephila clavipes]
MCDYSTTNRASISKMSPEGILIQGSLRASYANDTSYHNVILTPSFHPRGRNLSPDDAKLYKDFNFDESTQVKKVLLGSLTCRTIIRLRRCRFSAVNVLTGKTDLPYKCMEASSRKRRHETTPLKVKGDIENVSSELDNGV